MEGCGGKPGIERTTNRPLCCHLQMEGMLEIARTNLNLYRNMLQLEWEEVGGHQQHVKRLTVVSLVIYSGYNAGCRRVKFFGRKGGRKGNSSAPCGRRDE
jgi:hypothetical protein